MLYKTDVKVERQLVGLPWAADSCPWVGKLRTVLPLTNRDVIRDSAVNPRGKGVGGANHVPADLPPVDGDAAVGQHGHGVVVAVHGQLAAQPEALLANQPRVTCHPDEKWTGK
jgi:hypothetical protein